MQGKFTAANWVFSLVVSVGAFFLRAPVLAAAAEPGSSIGAFSVGLWAYFRFRPERWVPASVQA